MHVSFCIYIYVCRISYADGFRFDVCFLRQNACSACAVSERPRSTPHLSAEALESFIKIRESLEQALELLLRKRPCADPVPAYRAQLRALVAKKTQGAAESASSAAASRS